MNYTLGKDMSYMNRYSELGTASQVQHVLPFLLLLITPYKPQASIPPLRGTMFIADFVSARWL